MFSTRHEINLTIYRYVFFCNVIDSSLRYHGKEPSDKWVPLKKKISFRSFSSFVLRLLLFYTILLGASGIIIVMSLSKVFTESAGLLAGS